MPKVLAITRGVPGAGKTTWAFAWVARNPGNRVRVGADEIATMLHPQVLGDPETYGPLFAAREQLVVHAIVETLLRSGFDVVCDGPFLLNKYVEAMREVGERCGAELLICDLTGVDVEICIARDEQRGREGGRSIGAREICRQLREFREHQRSADAHAATAGMRCVDVWYRRVVTGFRGVGGWAGRG